MEIVDNKFPLPWFFINIKIVDNNYNAWERAFDTDF